MSLIDRTAREGAIADCLRALDNAVGDEEPSHQAVRIMRSIMALRSDAPTSIPIQSNKYKERTALPVDYLKRVQDVARAVWAAKWPETSADPTEDATAGVDTPLGRLTLTTWRRAWSGDAKGERIAWAGEYSLDGEPISVREIRAAGLAQRPTTRNRKSK